MEAHEPNFRFVRFSNDDQPYHEVAKRIGDGAYGINSSNVGVTSTASPDAIHFQTF
jgi:hypothetical protein